MGEQAFRFSGAAAANYDKYLGPFLFEPSSELISRKFPDPFTGDMLEVAAGTGRLTRHLAQRLGKGGSLVVTDLSEDMLALARTKTNDPAVGFRTADAQTLPFEEGSFDMVVCQYGLMFLPDKQKGFDEAFRVLRRGGEYVFATWDDTANMPVLDIIFGKIIVPFFGGQADKYLVPFLMHDPVQLSDHMTKAGFRDILIEPITFTGTTPDVEELVNGFFLHHSLGKEVAEKDPDAFPVLADRMRRLLTERFGKGPITCDLRAWVGQGMK